MVALAEMGHDCFTLSPDIAQELLESDLSAEAFADFEATIKGV
jgi:hypothetical protein